MQKKLYILVTLLLLQCSPFGGWGAFAQTYPVTISTQLTQPSPIYLSNYANTASINSPIKVQLILNDLTIMNRQVRLKCYFQGAVSFVSNDFVVGATPIYLEGGFPTLLTNVELGHYFEFQNLQGINPNQYAKPLPEGIYTISFEVYDFATNKKLSKKSSVTTVIFQNEPPLLNLPVNKAGIVEQNIQNVIFSWTPRSINVSNVEYEFSLVEIWNTNTPIQNAFAYSPPLYTITTRNTTVQYSIAEPQLIPGKTYAWRVKAKALVGAEEIGVFKNNGYSEIFSFKYLTFCKAPLAITTTDVSQDQAKVAWSGEVDNYDYQVNYREKNADSKWYKLVTPREYITISNLKPKTTYEYTVGAACDPGEYTHSNIQEFTTLAQDEIAFVGCGIKPDPAALSNKTPLPALFTNDVVTAGDFPIVVLKSTGSNGTFSGEGYVTLPFLEKFRELIDAADALGGDKVNIGKYSRIRITFNNIGINTDFKLISGEIVASYDKNWGGMVDGDKLVNDIMGDTGTVIPIDVQFEIKSVVKNSDGTLTITGTNGAVNIQPKTANDVIITDRNGNQYAVSPNTPASEIKSTGKAAAGGVPTPQNTNGMGSGGNIKEISSPDVSITFAAGTGFYSLDENPNQDPKLKANTKLNKTYDVIPRKDGSNYYVNYKVISDAPNAEDYVTAKATFSNGKTTADVVFKTENGTEIKPVWSGNVATLPLKRTLDFAKESILATVRPPVQKETADPKNPVVAGKYDIAGTLNLWHMTGKKVNVTLVGLNGGETPTQKDAQDYLNSIYGKAGIQFEVSTIKVDITDSWGASIETGDSDLLNTYTNGQQTITNNFQTQLGTSYKTNTYYVLFTKVTSSKPGTLGFMPLKRQFGFVFSQSEDKKLHTLAHELGHGVFGLQHPFTEYNTAVPTDLLMDYGTGTALSHNDWEIMHAPGLQLYQFTQGSSAGALAGNLAVKSVFDELDYKNATVFKFVNNETREFYYRGYKIIFKHKNLQVEFDNNTRQFNVSENGIKSTLTVLNYSNSLIPILCYTEILPQVPKISDSKSGFVYTEKDLIKFYALYPKANYEVEAFKGSLPSNDLVTINEKLKKLDAIRAKKIISLLESLPLNEVLEICPTAKECYDIFGKEYSVAEWDKIIELLEKKKNSLGVDLTKLAVTEQLNAIKALLLDEKNKDKICRLILSEVRAKREVLEYPKTFRLEYLGNNSGKDQFRIQLLENYKIAKVESIFTMSCALNQNIVNDNNVAFDLSLESSTETVTIDNLSKGTSAAEALSNLIGKTVLVSSVTIPAVYAAAEYLIASEAYTTYLGFLETQNGKCLNNFLADIALQYLIDALVRSYNGEGIPFSYTSPAVACGSAYLGNIGGLESCGMGALVSLGDTVIHNIKTGQAKPIGATIDDATVLCAISAGLHKIVSINYVNAVKEAGQWFSIKKLIDKTLTNAEKSIVAKFMVKYKASVSKDLLAKLINNSGDDFANTIKKLEEYLANGNKIVQQGEEIIIKDLDDKIIVKFENEEWKAANEAVRFIAKTGAELKTHLSKLATIPISKSYNGDLIRSLSIKSENEFKAVANKMTSDKDWSSWGRYDLDGAQNAMYLNKTVSGNQTELSAYGQWADYSTYKFENIKVDNLLDLTDDVVRQQLGTQFDDLVKNVVTLNPDDAKLINYEFTNEIASWARKNGYNGIIAPGARGAKDYESIILFDQNYIDNILVSKVPKALDKISGKWGVTLDATKLGMDDATILASKWIIPEVGWYDVVIHGTPDNFMIYTGEKWVSITHRDLVNYLTSKGYKNGTPIRLISCNTGVFPDAIAKNLANKIGANVKAPKGYITVFEDGSYIISNSGNWQIFNPGL